MQPGSLHAVRAEDGSWSFVFKVKKEEVIVKEPAPTQHTEKGAEAPRSLFVVYPLGLQSKVVPIGALDAVPTPSGFWAGPFEARPSSFIEAVIFC